MGFIYNADFILMKFQSARLSKSRMETFAALIQDLQVSN